METENKFVIVIHEKDLEDDVEAVVGVATTREDAQRMITQYYGRDAVISEFEDIRENGVDFSCKITVSGKWGGVYEVWGADFELNNI